MVLLFAEVTKCFTTESVFRTKEQTLNGFYFPMKYPSASPFILFSFFNFRQTPTFSFFLRYIGFKEFMQVFDNISRVEFVYSIASVVIAVEAVNRKVGKNQTVIPLCCFYFQRVSESEK